MISRFILPALVAAAAAAPSAPYAPSSSGSCMGWCNAWTCGLSSCSGCSTCTSLAAGEYCAGFCSKWTCSVSQCKGCSACQEHCSTTKASPMIAAGTNPCAGKKPYDGLSAGDNYFANQQCLVDGVMQTVEQAGANVTAGYTGLFNAGSRTPITDPYWKAGLCPVNVHWHLGAEHLSKGQFDETGTGPSGSLRRRYLAAGSVRKGFQCKKYDASDSKFTKPYDWKHCTNMVVGETYEVHWPHSKAGACGTVNQYQTPFYDGVFCNDGIISLSPLNTWQNIGVQSQVFTIVNDEHYYYPDLMKGMIVDGDFGSDIAKYTGSTTGTSRSNTVCSRYTPITWQVDRKCHLISASTFDKMCADMKSQRDDMSGDVYPHGSRELVADQFAANNLV